MGTLEERARKRRKRKDVQHATLVVIASVGIAAVAGIIPGVLIAFSEIKDGRRKSKLRFQTKTAIGRLIAKGYARKNARGLIRITEVGERFLAIEQARATQTARTKRRWDGQYRLVMFDIPQYRRRTRDRLRELMTAFGFLRLQDSVWVTPYDCEDLVALVKTELRIGKDVLYAVVDQLENDGWIRKHFELS